MEKDDETTLLHDRRIDAHHFEGHFAGEIKKMFVYGKVGSVWCKTIDCNTRFIKALLKNQLVKTVSLGNQVLLYYRIRKSGWNLFYTL